MKMNRLGLFILGVSLAAGFGLRASSLAAEEVVYVESPPCSYCQSAPPTYIKRYRYHRTHKRVSHYHRPYRSSSNGLFVYYPLPEPDCCDDQPGYYGCHCCAHYGTWSSNYWMVFRVAPQDIVYSDTFYYDYDMRNDPFYGDTVYDDNDDDPSYWDPYADEGN